MGLISHDKTTDQGIKAENNADQPFRSVRSEAVGEVKGPRGGRELPELWCWRWKILHAYLQHLDFMFKKEDRLAHQSPLCMEFSRQEYWRGLSFPSPGDLPNRGIEPMSPALASGFLTTKPPGKPQRKRIYENKGMKAALSTCTQVRGKKRTPTHVIFLLSSGGPVMELEAIQANGKSQLTSLRKHPLMKSHSLRARKRDDCLFKKVVRDSAWGFESLETVALDWLGVYMLAEKAVERRREVFDKMKDYSTCWTAAWVKRCITA